MDGEKNELEDLAREVQNLINDNRKFLDRIMDDDFEPEDDGEGEEEEAGVVEEL
jgi:hypothetical protein